MHRCSYFICKRRTTNVTDADDDDDDGGGGKNEPALVLFVRGPTILRN